MNTLQVNVVSAEEMIFSGRARFVALPGESGELGIYPRHTPLITRIKPGSVRIHMEDGREEFVFVAGGILEIQPDVVTVLSDTAIRGKDLDEAIGFCTVLEKASGNLEELDVEQTLARLAAREEQGVTFVNIERTDRKGERIRGACIGAALFVALMAFVIATMAWAFYSDPQEAPPLPLLIVLFGIPVGCIVGTLKVLLERIEEIGKGEEDAYRNY